MKTTLFCLLCLSLIVACEYRHRKQRPNFMENLVPGERTAIESQSEPPAGSVSVEKAQQVQKAKRRIRKPERKRRGLAGKSRRPRRYNKAAIEFRGR